MSRNTARVAGWAVVAVAGLSGLLTVPVWNVEGSTSGGSVVVESAPFNTIVRGTGQFTQEAYWSVSWAAAVVCGLVLAAGVWLIRRHSASVPAGQPGAPNQSLHLTGRA